MTETNPPPNSSPHGRGVTVYILSRVILRGRRGWSFVSGHQSTVFLSSERTDLQKFGLISDEHKRRVSFSSDVTSSPHPRPCDQRKNLSVRMVFLLRNPAPAIPFFHAQYNDITSSFISTYRLAGRQDGFGQKGTGVPGGLFARSEKANVRRVIHGMKVCFPGISGRQLIIETRVWIWQ